MRARWKNLRREQRGASLVELALVLPLFMLMIAGIVDLGWAFNNFMIITNASREGARYASHFPSDSVGIIRVTRQEAEDSGINPADITVTITGLGASGGQRIRVTTAYGFRTILGGFIGIDTLPLQAYTEMVVFGLD